MAHGDMHEGITETRKRAEHVGQWQGLIFSCSELDLTASHGRPGAAPTGRGSLPGCGRCECEAKHRTHEKSEESHEDVLEERVLHVLSC